MIELLQIMYCEITVPNAFGGDHEMENVGWESSVTLILSTLPGTEENRLLIEDIIASLDYECVSHHHARYIQDH